MGLQSNISHYWFRLAIARIVVEYTYRSPRGRICARGRITNIKVRSRRLFGMSWSIGCCFVCLFFDYFFSVGGCVFLCRIFFMSRYADALCIGPWRMICVVMHRMWVTMAKSMSMAGIVMGRDRTAERVRTTDDNNHLHHPSTTHPTKVQCGNILQHVVHPWAPSRHAPINTCWDGCPLSIPKDTTRPLRHLPPGRCRCEPFVNLCNSLALGNTARKGTFSSMPYHPTQDNNININTTTAIISKG